MNIATLQFNPIGENTYIVWDQTKECAIIDAGNCNDRENQALFNFIAEKGLTPKLAINTHGHFDHVMGVEALREKYGVQFAISSDDKFLLDSSTPGSVIYGVKVGAMPQTIDIDLKESCEITFGETTLRVIATPGHTPGHVSLFEPTSKVLFTGDTLFKESIGRTDLPGGDYSWIMKSILESLIPLGDDVEFFPGHGPSSTIGHEVLYNPFVVEVINAEVNYK
ncbi:MAG: MBL fold metallo-hydrolase [Rikenellaceae bacterium]